MVNDVQLILPFLKEKSLIRVQLLQFLPFFDGETANLDSKESGKRRLLKKKAFEKTLLFLLIAVNN